MKKIKSIYLILTGYLIVVAVSFLVLHSYSTSNLKQSLMTATKIQMDYSGNQLTQKIKEFEIEADGILNSSVLKNLQLVLSDPVYDSYEYVTAAVKLKNYLQGRQQTNVGMASFNLYWPDSGRVISSEWTANLDRSILPLAEDNQWIIAGGGVYFVRQYRTDWDDADDEPYMFIRMEGDYLYKIKRMVSGAGEGGTLMLVPDGQSLFALGELEETVYQEIIGEERESRQYEIRAEGEKYQVLESEPFGNGLKLIAYYPIRKILAPVRGITLAAGVILGGIVLAGTWLLYLYQKNILGQLSLLIEKLRQVENGDLSARIAVLPDNEFAYVFVRFNQMVEKIHQLLLTTLKEQQLRSEAEKHQLQAQIHPHFLYNSLSYIVTVADCPEAVTEMAVHLSNYYRYITVKKEMTTIGEEVSYAKAYLSIMAMRKNIEYSFSAAKELEMVPMLPLVLEPIIENAIEHGIEERENARHIFIKIYQFPGGSIRFEISDDGAGLTDEESRQLLERISKKEREETESVGLWNVNQRLINFYGSAARIHLARSFWGGLTVSFMIPPERIKHDSIDRG